MKLVFYKLLTQLIILLAFIREKISDSSLRQIRIDRTFYCSNDHRWTCCDCGLEHAVKPIAGEPIKEKAFRFIPIRIKNYDYKMRWLAEKPAPSVDERGLK